MTEVKKQGSASSPPLLLGVGLLLGNYVSVGVHHWKTTQGIAVQPSVWAGIILVLGFLAFKRHRAATWVLLILSAIWLVEGITAAVQPNMEWLARLVPAAQGLLTGTGGFFLWRALQVQKQEWLAQMFTSQDLHKATMVFDPDHDEPFLEKVSHLFDVGFGKLQIKEILDSCRYVGKEEARTRHFAPYYFRQQVPLQVVLAKDGTNSMDIHFFTTRELAGRIEERKETYMEALGVK